MAEEITTEEEEKEVNSEVLTEEEKAAAAAEAEEEGEDASTEGEKKAEDEKGEEGEGEEKEGKDEELSVEELLRIELAELKERNTTLDQNLRNMESKFNTYDKVLREANLLDEVDEEQQKEIDRAVVGRKIFLDQMWETMAMNPKYEDIEQVVTAHNKQLVISAYAEQLTEDDPSIEMSTAEIAVKQSINELTNPHKFFYEQIKIIEKGNAEEGKEKERKKEEVGKKKAELKDAPGSLQNMGGANKGAAGWTMKKLDDMDEETMANANIPEDILEQWKKGTLPK